MIFELKTTINNEPALVFNERDSLNMHPEQACIMLRDAFPDRINYVGCYGQYANCVVLTNERYSDG